MRIRQLRQGFDLVLVFCNAASAPISDKKSPSLEIQVELAVPPRGTCPTVDKAALRHHKSQQTTALLRKCTSASSIEVRLVNIRAVKQESGATFENAVFAKIALREKL